MSDETKAFLTVAGMIVFFVAAIIGGELALQAWNQGRIDDCLAASEATYSQRWDEECIDEGKQADCGLAVPMADSFRAELNAANTICVLRY